MSEQTQRTEADVTVAAASSIHTDVLIRLEARPFVPGIGIGNHDKAAQDDAARLFEALNSNLPGDVYRYLREHFRTHP